MTIGILLLVFRETLGDKFYWDDDAAAVAGILITGIFGFAVVVMSGVFIATAARSNYDYEVLEAQRVSLELRLEKTENAPEDSIVEINSLYNDIYEYNMEVKSYKTWGNNPWTCWFYSRKCTEDLKYVELKT
jgi:hypothetical protein